MDEESLQAELDNLYSGHHRDYRGRTSEQKQLHDRVRHLCQYYLWPEYRERVKERAREAKRQRRKGDNVDKPKDKPKVEIGICSRCGRVVYKGEDHADMTNVKTGERRITHFACWWTTDGKEQTP